MAGRLRTLVVVGQIPPPLHGQAIMIERMLAGLRERLPMIHVPMRFSHHIDQVGRVHIGKLFHLLALIGRTIVTLIRSRPAVMYYPPASPAFVPVIRDIVFLACVRPFAAGTVLHFHANGLAEFLGQHPVLSLFARPVYRRPLLAIALSSACSEDATYVDAHRIEEVPNGIPGAPRVARQREHSDPFTVLYMGSIQPAKGIDDAIEVAARLNDKGVACSFRMVGDWMSDEYHDACLEKVRARGLEQVVCFPGSVSGDEKWEEFKRSSVFLFPSHYPVEGMSVAVIEAMSAGLPVVASRWRAQVDLVEHGATGFLVRPRDISGYTEAIKRLHRDSQLRAQCGKRGRLRFERYFTEEKHLARLEEALRPALLQEACS